MESRLARAVAGALLLVSTACTTGPEDPQLGDSASATEAAASAMMAEDSPVSLPAGLAPTDERLAAFLGDICVGRDNGPVTNARLLKSAPLAESSLPWVYEAPFLIMTYPAPRDAVEQRRAERELPRTARLLGDVARRFHASFTGPAGLPAPASHDGVIPVFLVSDVDGMSACLGGRETPDELASSDARFAPDPLRLVLRLTFPTRRGVRCANEGFQGTTDQNHAHEAVHALTYVASGMRDNGGLPFALSEGLAYLIGTVEVPLGAEDELPVSAIRANRIALHLVQAGRQAKSQDLGAFPLAEVLAARHSDDVRAAMERAGASADLGTSAWFMDAWALTYFLWNFDDGRYRGGLQEFLARTWTGDAPPSLFAALGVDEPQAQAHFERELIWYRAELLRRRVGRRSGGGWWRPITTAPEGTPATDE